MRKAFLLFLLSACFLSAQTVIDVQNMTVAATASNTLLTTVTGTDGTVCKLYKIPGASIYAFLTCANGTKYTDTATVKAPAAGASAFTRYVCMGTGGCPVAFLVAVNPTTATVPVGSLGTAPINGIAWSTADGDGVTITTGTVTWP